MKRTNEFEVVPQSDEDEELFRRLLDASAALWNEINYQRRTNFDDPDGDVWEIDEYRGRYGGTLGSSTVQQIERKNREAWRSFFALTQRKGRSQRQARLLGQPRRGARTADIHPKHVVLGQMGRTLPARNLVGQDLKEEYGLGYQERLRLEVQGDPNWKEYDKQGRLELYYDDVSETFRAFSQSQPTILDWHTHWRTKPPLWTSAQTISSLVRFRLASSTCTKAATCSSGSARLRNGSQNCNRSSAKAGTVRSKSTLTVSTPDATAQPRNGRDRSRRDRTAVRRGRFDSICRRSHRRTRDALVGSDERQVAQTSGRSGGSSSDSSCTGEEYGITVEVRTEAWTSQTCPNCGSTEDTTRHQDTVTCTCGFEGHADLSASKRRS